MSKDLNINVKHITRVEGHGNIVVNAKNGKVERCEWQVPEAPRFFEARREPALKVRAKPSGSPFFWASLRSGLVNSIAKKRTSPQWGETAKEYR